MRRNVVRSVGLLVSRPGRFLLLLLGCATAAHAGPHANCGEPIPDIYQRVAPAVVSILSTSIDPYNVAQRIQRSEGSGFFIDKAGHILTNAHVVYGAQSLVVVLADGTNVSARLIGADPVFDLAVIRALDLRGQAPAVAMLGDSQAVRVGEEALAIGSPLGLEQSLTRGVVSAINRILPVTPFPLAEPFIQVDTPINPGNSGGPLLNRCGEVIGVNTSIIQGAQNIGFSIPINLAKRVLPALIKHGKVVRPWLGFNGQLIGADLQDILRLPLAVGFLVEAVEPGSPAAKAGLHGGAFEIVLNGNSFLVGGDVITELNGTRLDSDAQLLRAVRVLKVGSKVSLTVVRDGTQRTVRFTLPERPILPTDLPGRTTYPPAQN